MRKLLCILLLTSPLFAQTFSVSGHVVDPTNSVPGSTGVTFSLVGTGNQQCKVSGTGLIVPSFVTFTPNVSTGVISGTLYRNDFIVCGNQSNTQWQYIVKSGGNPQPACILAQVASSSLNLDNTACSNTTPVVVPPTGDNTYCRLDGSNCGFTGAISAGAGLSASSATISGAVSAFTSAGSLIGKFSTISAAYAALPSGLGGIFVGCGTYTENLTITTAVTIWGADPGCVIVRFSNNNTDLITIDATSVSAIDGVTLKNLQLQCTVSSVCANLITITGKQNTTQPNDHIILDHVILGAQFQVNTAGTTGFLNAINITGRTIYSTFKNVEAQGGRGVGLKIALTGGTVGPVNDLTVEDSQFNGFFAQGITIDCNGAVSPCYGNTFHNVEMSQDGNNTALTPCAGIVISGVWSTILDASSMESNCPSTADATSSQVRIMGSLASPQQIIIHNLTTIMAVSGSKYAIYNDATRSASIIDGVKLLGTAPTAGYHESNTSSDSHNVLINASSLGKLDIVADANGNTHTSVPAMTLVRKVLINTTQCPISGAAFDLVTGCTGSIFPVSDVTVFNGPTTVSNLTSGTINQTLRVCSESGAITLTNSAGGAGQMVFDDVTTRVLQTNRCVLLRRLASSDTWQEISGLGDALLNRANVWSQAQQFSSTFTKYNGISLTGNGIPSQIATVDLTGQTAAVGTTTLATSIVAGQYRLSWNAKVTTAAATSSTLGALTITYTDPDGTVVGSVVPAAISGGSIATTATTNNTATTLTGMPLLLNVKSGTTIQYAFAYASNVANTMAYNLHIKLELM